MSSANESLRSALDTVDIRPNRIGEYIESPKGRFAKGSRYNLLVPLRESRVLAYNSVTQSLAVWTSEETELYRSLEKKSTELWSRELRDFVYGGYVVPDATDELAEQEAKYNGARFDATRMTLTVAPTMACNFGCDYCFQGADKPSEKMSLLVQDVFMKYLEQKLETVKHLHIAWYGGEPLLGIDIIDSLSVRILALCKEKGVRYSGFIVTNGYSLNRETAQRLVRLGVDTCQVTLDGPKESHDQRRALLSGRETYERIVSNMRSWIEDVKLSVSIRVNIDERNVDGIRRLVDDLETRGFGRRRNFAIYFAPVEAITDVCHGCSDVALNKRHYANLETELYRYAFDRGLCPLPRPPVHLGHCQAIRPNGLLLLPNGDLHKCWDTVHDKGHRVGTIYAHSQVAENPRYQSWVSWSPFKNSTCRGCKILPNCAGACAHKFVNRDVTKGEAGSLPCPSWKFGIGERLLLRAEKMGIITSADFPEEKFVTTSDLVGHNHSAQSLAEAAAAA